ncbi:3-isopropylmalate dehydrogenase (plasmid) [Buchnera aphidicola (Nipponaphis monzeni)]|uniref:3-isopropylmalate dehydrogenase n=1 Tax=Buchnera aphidicola (Nipponaphis monzeni) TaxID=2495405 RepID=A0A455TAW3_9GAMM|nr:3-isopropylmalate dehydrogenase [Buchnera aphidicola]BBI01455.1 3-isopropylmalate dehydrogenase [Buchnera aphidicola (Nipponaphis monzeni)]
MKKKYNIAILPGDGIGPEIIREGYKIIKILNEKFHSNINTQEYIIGGASIDKYGLALTKKTLLGCKQSDAILFGSVGGEKWNKLPENQRPEKAALLKLRKKFNLFANIRPSKLYPCLINASPLKRNIIEKGINILCIRELIEGIYFGPSGIEIINNLEKRAFDTELYYQSTIEKIAKFAFKIAQKNNYKITSIDKSNVLKSSLLWRNTVTKISKEFPNVQLSHLYVDNAVMQIVKCPSQFDILLSSNLFGDIISDECAAITGSIGMLPSASLNENGFALYEPAGGSAPDIQGKNIANPIAQILSIAMLAEYTLKSLEISNAIEYAVHEALKLGYRTLDILNLDNKKDYISTSQMGDFIAQILKYKA